MEDHDGVSKMANFSIFYVDEIDYNFTVQVLTSLVTYWLYL